MNAWIVKTEIYDPDRACEIVEEQRTKGYSAWIEDEHGKVVDEQLLKTNGGVAIERTLSERWTGPLTVVASVIFGLVVLYLIGLWVD